MKTENFLKFGSPLCNFNSPRAHSQARQQRNQNNNSGNNRNSRNDVYPSSSSLLTSENLKRFTRRNSINSDREGSVCSGVSSAIARSKRLRARNFSMKSSKGISKKTKSMDYTNYAYNEAVGRLKVMLADNSYATPKTYLRNYNEDSGDNFSDNLSVIDRPILSDISKYLSPSQKARLGAYRPKKFYSGAGAYSSSKENLAAPAAYQSPTVVAAPPPMEYLANPTSRPQLATTDSVHAPVEIFNFIEKQEDYIEQLEKESKYCRSELTNLLGKVKDVINENEQLTETARSEMASFGAGGSGNKHNTIISPSSDSDEQQQHLYTSNTGKKTPTGTPRKKESALVKSPRYGANAPNIVYEARISELEAELMQANIDLKRIKNENEELKRKLANTDPLSAVATIGGMNCDTHRKQIELLQKDKVALEDTVRHLQKLLDDAKSSQYNNNNASKRYINDLVQMERSQAELEVKHLRDELDRQHERVRELQHEMARRLADERANAERRYNTQVDQLGGDLSSQWEQVAKLQLDLERQKRYETDLKRDVSNRNAQIEELKAELRSNRSTFLADMAQVNAEKQSLEQEITSLRLQLDRGARESKTEAARLNAEINSLRQRLDRGDADLLHSKREVLRLNDEIANLEKELAYGELKNEIRPTKKDLDKRISEMQDKHAETVNELEEMIQSQKQLMDKLTSECKTLTNKLEDTTLKHKTDKEKLHETNENLMTRLRQIWSKYKSLSGQLNRRSSSATSSDIELDNAKMPEEEHFPVGTTTTRTTSAQQQQQNLIKPLSTTSRPHLAQPTPFVQHSTPMTTPNQYRHQVPTTTMHYSENQAPEEPSPQQLLRQLQQRHLTSQQQQAITTAKNTSLVVTLAATKPTPATIMDSTITMTKISKTTLAWAKNNNNNNNNSYNHSSSLPVSLANPMAAVQTTPIRTWPPVMPITQQQQQQQQPGLLITTQTTAPTVAMMINNNMIPAHMTQVPTISSSTINNNHNRHTVATNTEPVAVPMTTAILTMDNLDTSMTPRQQQPQQTVSQQPQQQQEELVTSAIYARHHRQTQQHRPHINNQHRQHQQHYHHQQHHHHHQQWQPIPCLQQVSPRSQQEAQQQRAAYNHARAAALWGHQVQLEQSPVENPLCHNSLPRQPAARSSCPLTPEDNKMIDPFELEFSISSPSLMCSCDSDTCTELAENDHEDVDDNGDDNESLDDETFCIEVQGEGDGDQENDANITDISISPAPTTIITVSCVSNVVAQVDKNKLEVT